MEKNKSNISGSIINQNIKKLSFNKISSEANTDELNIRRERISNLIFIDYLCFKKEWLVNVEV